MGTSGAYGGSPGRALQTARQRARALSDHPTDRDVERVVNAAGPGLGFDDAPPPDVNIHPPVPGDQPAEMGERLPSWGPISALRSSGGGRGGSGGAGGGAGRGRRDTPTGTGRRSVRQAARAGGRAARAASALVTGNARILAEEFGLRLADLVGLSAPEQAQRIAAQIVVGDSIENAELLKATDKLLLAQIEAKGELSPLDLGRLFVTTLVEEAMATELGAVFAKGTRTKEWVVDVSRQVRDVIRARVDGLVVDGTSTVDTESVITAVLGTAQAVLAERRGAR